MIKLDSLNKLCEEILNELKLEEKANKVKLNNYKTVFSKILADMNIDQFDKDVIKFTKIRSHYRNLFNSLNLLITILDIDNSTTEGKMMFAAYAKQFDFYKEKFLEETY